MGARAAHEGPSPLLGWLRWRDSLPPRLASVTEGRQTERAGEERRGEGLLSSPRLASVAEGRQTEIQSRRNGLAWRLACVVVGHQNVFGIAIGTNDIALHELCHSILFDRVEHICYPKAAFKVFMYVGVTSHTSYHRCSLSGCCFALIPCLVNAPVGHMGY